ncbi:ATP-binding protein [Metasolibacillus meyeri]|uniref:histidine kinase n=1 Tax=Metasolibacillus meyeri TaxID=1071052 RepID=A0AAW9NSS4_9BACL|nr:ATP-binding protein [Metasolibacillus meyeri]MEC1177873.1 ATP-binding protein [Metasolibacillus meyeri]
MLYQRISLLVIIFSLWLFALVEGIAFNSWDRQFHALPAINNVALFLYNHATDFVGFLFLITGFYAYMKKPQAVVIQRFFHLMCVVGLAITYAKASAHDLFIPARIEAITLGLVPYFLVRFIEYFPVPNSTKLLRGHQYIALSVAISIVVVDVFREEIFWSPYFVRFALIINVLLAVIICGYYIGEKWFSQLKWLQNQLLVLFVSLLLSFAPILFNLIQAAIFNYPTMPFAFFVIPMGLFPISLAYLLTKQEIVDFKLVLKQATPVLVAFVLTLLIIAQFFSLPSVYIVGFLIGGGVFVLLYQAMKYIENRYVEKKLRAIQQEKQQILKQLDTSTFLTIYAERVVQLIHKILEIEGAAVIWSQPTLTVLYDSGVFQHSQLAQQDIHRLLKRQQSHHEILKQAPYYTLPLTDGVNIVGMIVIGQKLNFTRWDNEELILLNKIHMEAKELFLQAQVIRKMDKAVYESQQTSYQYQLLQALEDERKHLSIFLHDEVLQDLLFALRNVRVHHYEHTEQTLHQMIGAIRAMCNDLYPIMVEEIGLALSLQSLQAKVEGQHGINVHINYEIEDDQISLLLAMQVFRILKELLTNSIKHAEAEDVMLTLSEHNGKLHITVEDNGCGFDVPNNMMLYAEQHFGLVTIQKKVEQLQGTFTITSQLGEGTTIKIELPVKEVK